MVCSRENNRKKWRRKITEKNGEGNNVEMEKNIWLNGKNYGQNYTARKIRITEKNEQNEWTRINEKYST